MDITNTEDSVALQSSHVSRFTWMLLMPEADDILADIGQRIKQVREDLGLVQEDLEELSGVNISDISLIENGKRNATVLTLQRLADALGVSLVRFMAPDFAELESAWYKVERPAD